MNCQDLQDNLERHVLGASSPAETQRLESHLAECPACRAAEEEMRLLVGEVRMACPPTSVRPGFGPTLRSALQAETGRRRSRRRVGRFLRTAAAVAASLLLGAGIWAGVRALRSPPTAPPHLSKDLSSHANQPQWRYAGATASPATQADDVVIRGANLYVLCAAGVAAVDRMTGRRRWVWQGSTAGYLAVNDTTVFCLARRDEYTTELLALDADGGQVRWRFSPDPSGAPLETCRPVALGAGAVCWTVGDTVTMLDATSGRPLWQRALDTSGAVSSVVTGGEDLYVGAGASVCCLDRKTGAIRWRQQAGRRWPRMRTPLLAACDGRLYFLQRSLGPRGQLFCLDLAGRRTLWDKQVAGIHCLRAGSGGVYLRGREIVALDESGRPRWSRRAEGCGPLALIDNLVCFVDTRQQGRLTALHSQTGKTAWDVGGIRSCDAFAQIGNTGYIKTQDGTVLALSLARRTGR